MSENQHRQTHPRFIKRILIAFVNVFSVLHVGLLLAYFILRETSTTKIWFVEILHYILPWLYIPLLFLLILAILLRRRTISILLLIPIPMFLFLYGELYLPRFPVKSTGKPISVMTHNLWGGNTQYDQILTGIETANPDLLSVHEFSPPLIDALEGPLSEDYPYYRITTWTGFFSRYPIIQSRAFRMGGIYGIPGPWAQHLLLDIDGVEVNVFNVHPPSPPLQGERILGLPLRLPTHFRTEGFEIATRELLWRMEQVEGPILVIGDLNFTDQEFEYTLLSQRLEDAHRESGWGMGFSFSRLPSSGIAMWRIDYVLYSQEFVALSTQNGDFAGSDHRPVIALLGWRP
jgi:endonuclease/exonuclease/phosphatase (EEP) superfamily protein YafD